MNEFLKDIIKETGNEYASLVSDGVEAGDVDEFIDGYGQKLSRCKS